MTTSPSDLSRRFLMAALVLALGACSKGPDAQKAATAPVAPLIISPEDVHTVANSALTSGPAITGSIQPERRADLRAEIQAIVMQVLTENGAPVHRRDLSVPLATTPLTHPTSSPPTP